MAWAHKYTTKYMQLELPIPGVTPGPDWAMMINEAFWKIDNHNHSGPGQGRRVLSSSIRITGDIDFGDDGNYNGINRSKYFQFLDIANSGGTPGNAGSLFCYKSDLWWQYSSTGGTAGTFCQITSYSRPVSVTSGFEPIHVTSSSYYIGSKLTAPAINQPTENDVDGEPVVKITLRNRYNLVYKKNLPGGANIAIR